MARGRFISKGISADEKVNALSDDTCRLLFTWLIAHLDCEGRMFGDAQRVKSIVFPASRISVNKIEKYLEEMEKCKLIFRYSVNGNQYLCQKNFELHQVGLQKHKEAQSQIPLPTPELLQSSSRKTLSEVKVKVKVKDNTPKGGQRKAQSPDSVINEIFAEMRTYLGYPEKVRGPGSPTPGEKKEAKDPIPNYGKEGKAIKRMLTRGFTREEILACWESKVSQRGGEFVSMTWVNEDIGKPEKQKRRPKELSTEAEIAASIKEVES